MSSGRAAWLPSAQQLLLLRACLWPAERGLAAWVEWRRAQPNLTEVEPGSQRLLPLLYRNLGPQLADDPEAGGFLKEAYRRSWAANELGLRIGRRAIDALQGAGLEVLALKGAALIGSAYRDPGARPMGDVDLAVGPGGVAAAVQALRDAGMRAIEDEPERLLAVRHSLAFRAPDGQEIDLHRGMLWRAGLDGEFWRGSIEADVAGARLRILNPADQLLHVCVHGAAWSSVHPVRWVADSFEVIEAAGGKLEWERLVAMAHRGRFTLPLAHALACLADDLEAPVPSAVVAELAAMPVSRRERRAHQALARPPSPSRSLAMLSWFWERYRAHAEIDGERPGASGFVAYMQGFWGLERPSQVPGYAARRLLGRLRA